METKENIRKEVFARRKQAEQSKVRQKSHQITEKILALPEYQKADVLFAYMDFKKEVMTEELIEAAFRDGKTVAVPKVAGDDMIYYEITDFSSLRPGYFGIPEPEGQEVCLAEEGFLLVPGVAFDRKCHRVGYGKGFYDRYLSAHPGFVTAAVAFEFQLFPEVPFWESDIRPQMLITEKEIYHS